MNGDVVSRDEGLRLAAEFGVDGAMIATAAEANSSVFLSEAEGGAKPWRQVVEQYLRYCLQTENKYGNTKFLLGQLIPGRDEAYRKVCQSRTYTDVLEALRLNKNPDLFESAKKVDHLLGLDLPKFSRADQKRANKAAARAQQEANIARKKRAAEEALQREQSKKERRKSPEADHHENGPTPAQKAEIATENARFEGLGQGALQVAV